MKENDFRWINDSDSAFAELFKASVEYVESKKKIENNLFNSMSAQPDNKAQIKEFAQFYTPTDVALYSAYQLLKEYQTDNVIFDPSVGKGSLLIAVGAVLAIKFHLRDKELLFKLHGSEICEDTYNETVDNILHGLKRWIGGIGQTEAKRILLKNIINKDFHKVSLPQNCLVIANPPYKEIKGKGNLWLRFSETIIGDPSVQSFAMIVPVSIGSAKRTQNIREKILKNFDEIIAFHHDTRPRPLFKNIEQRISIIIAHKNGTKQIYRTTGFLTHKAGERINIWKQSFTTLSHKHCKNVFPKVSQEEVDFFKKHYAPQNTLMEYVHTQNDTDLWIRTTGRYSLVAQFDKPEELTTKWKKVKIHPKGATIIIEDFRNGEVLRWWKMFGDGRDFSIPNFLNSYKVENG